MSKGPRLSVLDQSPIPAGGTGAQSLRNSIDLAVHAEQLGYERYWVAEHHGMPMLACGAPEIMVAEIAAATSRIRVGSGGVILPHYSPFKVAEVFSVLAGIHGKRIDLGIGRAFGGDVTAVTALQRDRSRQPADDFTEQLVELLAYFEGGFPGGHPFAELAALPGRPGMPEVWLLGTSPQSALWAAELGLPYAVADFISPDSAPAGHLYRGRFAPSRTKQPQVLVAVGVVCAETDGEARRQASSWSMAITLAGRGRSAPLPSVTEALAFLTGEPEAGFAGRRVVVGSPETVRAGLEQIAEEYGADEVMIHTLVHNHPARRRSYELLAEVFELTALRKPR